MRLTLLGALLVFAGAADAATFYDNAGRPVGSSRVDANGVTHFYDRAGRPNGSARTDTNGVTHFYDANGHPTGRVRR